MNRHTVITAAAIAVIVAPFMYSAMSIYGAQQMEYRWGGPDEFSYFAMSNHGGIEFCNVLPMWVSVEGVEIAPFYQGEYLGSYTVESMTIDPLSPASNPGKFSSETRAASQHIFMAIDFELADGDIRLDPSQFVMIINVDTPILGFIPYSTTTQMDLVDFGQMMDGKEWTCN